MKASKLYEKALSGALKNFRFQDFCKLVEAFGYKHARTAGSHHIYKHPQAERPLNLQNYHGQAKPYQIRQFLRDVEEFKLTLRG